MISLGTNTPPERYRSADVDI